eukprot:TRINITY_DN8258_c0_g1_i1.p1 TRINITY_DN8258_c0_g1~~TRINITY_DN8258_c0_g1_i1.p1  ORF type:complete len:425 (-),score=203.38 TRINITY_DN8258_c0_g1_i1:79-1311(-)
MPLDLNEQNECALNLQKSIMFKNCDSKDLVNLCSNAKKKIFEKGEVLVNEGKPQEQMFILASGSIVREKLGPNGETHVIDTQIGGATVGSLHVLKSEASFATSRCVSQVKTYQLSSQVLEEFFLQNPKFGFDVAHSLSKEVRRHTRLQRTPLLDQSPKKAPLLAVSIAASIESFYRAGMNAWLNQQLTGIPMTKLFPNMHIQIPTRVCYINGLKGLRTVLKDNLDPDSYQFPTLVRVGSAILPGLLMTPFSSILEASNAGHANPEPLKTRWTRGLIPRVAREVIFGIGLNQLSDYCEERVPTIENDQLRNAIGSLTAGVISGYLSHVVHNLSTLKLMNPNKTYSQHFKEYCAKSESRIPITLITNPYLKRMSSILFACIFPSGVIIRTSQIVGSFIILNGTILNMQKFLN